MGVKLYILCCISHVSSGTGHGYEERGIWLLVVLSSRESCQKLGIIVRFVNGSGQLGSIPTAEANLFVLLYF